MADASEARLAAALSQAETPADFHAGLRGSLESFDRLNEQTIATSGVKLACCAGCSLCCSLRVDVFAHEVFLIADYIHTRFSPEEMAELRNRLAIHTEQVLALTPFEHATRNIRCPLLRDGRCSVYAVRPQACRRHHSLDLAACQFTYDHPTDLEFLGAQDGPLFQTLTDAMQRGFEVYRALGFDPAIYELGTALEEALTEPASWTHWRNRENAFLTASITPAR